MASEDTCDAHGAWRLLVPEDIAARGYGFHLTGQGTIEF